MLEVKNISKSFAEKKALDEVSFKVKNIGYQERGLGKIHQDCVDYKNNHGANNDR